MHPSQRDILDYLRGSLPDEKAQRLVTHLDACAPCQERHDAVRRLRDDFAGSWDEFLSEWEHRRLLGPGSAGHPRALLRLQSVLDGARRLTTVACEAALGAGERFSLGTALRPSYGGVGDPGEATMALQRQASVLLGQDSPEEALETLEKVSATQPDVAASSLAELTVDGVNVGHVVVDARNRSLSVLLQNGFLHKHALRASVRVAVRPVAHGASRHADAADEAPKSEALQRVDKPLQAVAGADYHLAEFEALPDGVIELTLELHPTS